MQWAALNDATRVGAGADPATARANRVTSEAEESRLTSSYEQALHFIRDGNRHAAAKTLREILEHDMMSQAPTHRVVACSRRTPVGRQAVTLTPTMTQVKFLALKNLGNLVADMADEAEARGETYEVPGRGGGVSDAMMSSENAFENSPGAIDDDANEPYGLALRCYAASVEIDGSDAGLWRKLGGLAARRGLSHLARHALEMGLAVHPKNALMLEDLAETLLAVGDFPAVKHVALLITTLDPRHQRASVMKRAPETMQPSGGGFFVKKPRNNMPAVDGAVVEAARGGHGRGRGRGRGRGTRSPSPSPSSPEKENETAVTLHLERRTWDALASCLSSAMTSPTTPFTPTKKPVTQASAMDTTDAGPSTSPAAPTTPELEQVDGDASGEEGTRNTFDPLSLLGRRVRFLARKGDGSFEEILNQPEEAGGRKKKEAQAVGKAAKAAAAKEKAKERAPEPAEPVSAPVSSFPEDTEMTTPSKPPHLLTENETQTLPESVPDSGRKSRRQMEAEEKERGEAEARRALEAQAIANAAAAAARDEQNKWTPLLNLSHGLTEATLGDDASAAAAATAADALAAAVPFEEPPERPETTEGVGDTLQKPTRTPTTDTVDLTGDSPDEPGAGNPARVEAPKTVTETETETFTFAEDFEETAEVTRFVSFVSGANSGAADCAWRLLRDVTSRWCPTQEGDNGDENVRAKASANASKFIRNQFTTKRAETVPGGFGLRRAPKPATLLRLAEVFGPGPVGGGCGCGGDAETGAASNPRVHLCLADAATRAARAAASVVWSSMDAKQRRRAELRSTNGRASNGGVLLSAAGTAAALVATDGLPVSFFAEAAKRHLASAVAAARDDDYALLAEFHFVSGNVAAFDGTISLAETRLYAAADAADIAEARTHATATAKRDYTHSPKHINPKPERLTAAAARAALCDIKLHAVVARADEKLAAGDTADLLTLLGELLFPKEGDVQKEQAHAPVVLTADERKHALRVLAAAASIEMQKRMEVGDGDGADAAHAVDLRARVALFHFELAASTNPAKPSAVETSKAMPALCEAARDAFAIRGSRWYAPDQDGAELPGRAAAREALATLAATFARLMEKEYAWRAVEPGAAAAAARKKMRGRDQILLKEEQMSTSVMERAAEALAVIQQIVTSADDPMDGLPPRQAKENVAFEDDTMERGATNNVGAAATDACPAPNTTPSPLAVLALHEHLHACLADCRCCCGSFQRGAFLRSSMPRLAAARAPLAAEAARLKALDDADAKAERAFARLEKERVKHDAEDALRVSRGGTLGGEASEDECPGLGESEDESEDDSGGVGSEDDDADPLVAGSGKKRVRGVNSSGKKITNKTGKTAAEMANESKGGGGVPTLGDGFVHYASHVYCQSNQRPESKHFDLTFQLFDLTGTYYQFKNCDQTGKYAPGKDVSLLRSKVAVARYLERDGLSTEDIEQQEAALKQAKDKAEEKLVLRKAAELAAEELVADEIENVPVVLGDSPVAETATAAVSRVVQTRRQAVDGILTRFDKALSQCMYCLYGVELVDPPRRCRSEGGARSASNLQTPEACAELWRHVQPWAATLKSTHTISTSFLRVLEKIREQFPPESAAPLDGDPVKRYLATTPSAAADDNEGDSFEIAVVCLDGAVNETPRVDTPDHARRVRDGDDPEAGHFGTGSSSRDEERRLAVAATTRAPPSTGHGDATDEDDDVVDDDDDEDGDAGGGGGDTLVGDAPTVDAPPVDAPPVDAMVVDPSPAKRVEDNVTALTQALQYRTYLPVAPAAVAAENAGMPRDRLDSPSAPTEDPAATYGFVHKTLHRFLVNVVDAQENAAAGDVLSDTFPKVLDVLRAHFAEGDGAADERGKDQVVVAAAGGSNRRRAPVPTLDAAQAARRAAALLKADLIHNPNSHQAWVDLADHIDQTKDMALNDAAKLVSREAWGRSVEAASLVQKLRLALRRACCAAVACATTDTERVVAHERSGLAAYELVQEAPPFHDGRRSRLRRGAARVDALHLARDAFDAASVGAPNEWTYKCMGAKTARKAFAPAVDIFKRLKETTEAAPGNLEAFYQTHATRVKLLLRARSTLETAMVRKSGDSCEGGVSTQGGGRGRGRGRGSKGKEKEPAYEPDDPQVACLPSPHSPSLAEARSILRHASGAAFDAEFVSAKLGPLQTALAAMDDGDDANVAQIWSASLDDATRAIAAAARSVPGYHKAHYRSAWSLLKRSSSGDLGFDSMGKGTSVQSIAPLTESQFGSDVDPTVVTAERHSLVAARNALAALKPLFRTTHRSHSKGLSVSGHGGPADAVPAVTTSPPKFAVLMWEIDDNNLRVRRGATTFGQFQLQTAGINESARKFVGATRRATRLWLGLCFATGDATGLVAANLFLNDNQRSREWSKQMADLSSLALAYAARLVGASLDSIGDGDGAVTSDSLSPDMQANSATASALAYWLWMEHGVVAVGGAANWDERVAEASEELALEMSFHELAKRGFSASTDQSEVDTVSDAPPNLIGECFAVTYQKTDKVDMSSSKFETHARKHVEGLTRNDDVASLLALYQDSQKRVSEAHKKRKAFGVSRKKPATPEELEQATGLARELRDGLRAALVRCVGSILGSGGGAGDGRVSSGKQTKTPPRREITQQFVASAFSALAAARALHKEASALSASARKDSASAKSASEYAKAAHGNAKDMFKLVKSGNDPMAPAPRDCLPMQGVALTPADGAPIDTEFERGQRLTRVGNEVEMTRTRIGPAAAFAEGKQKEATAAKAFEIENAALLVRAVGVVKNMLGANDAAAADADAETSDSENSFGEGGPKKSRERKDAAVTPITTPNTVDQNVVAAAEADMLLKARENSVRVLATPEKKKTTTGRR